MKVVLAGGAGSLGRRVAADLAGRGHEVVVLTRSPDRPSPHRQVGWDGRTVGEWAAELDGAAVVNLAGALVDRPPTPANVELLTRSRVEPTAALAQAARHTPVWVQISTLAIYGDAGDTVLDETAPPADGPPQMAGVAKAWEAAAAAALAATPETRLVVLRTGIVFDRGTPALKRLTGLVRWGLGGPIAGGRQWISWLHIEDFLAIVRLALVDPSLAGTVHATSPNPVTNGEMMAAFRSVLHRRWAPPTPAPLVRLGGLFLRTDPALALTGRRCVPKRLLDQGFTFTHPDLRPALADLLGPKPGKG